MTDIGRIAINMSGAFFGLLCVFSIVTGIIYMSGKVAKVSHGAKPQPGCEIVVPSKKYKEPFRLSDLQSVTTPLTTIAMLIVALSRL